MGQLFLGFRSLLFKLGVFIVLAALLAWILGGTLWPRPETARINAVEFAGDTWFWQIAVGGSERGNIEWTLKRQSEDVPPEPVDERDWIEVAGPIETGDTLVYAGLLRENNPDGHWTLVRLDSDGERHVQELPDRLAVETIFASMRSDTNNRQP